ncbi:MAG: TerB family tellurite resistance protein [Bacteroidales bacterium]|nr:TerB family tellurite resistance protein [Bacteroidales bacterium]
MAFNDLLLKTVFSCMACDGSIATEEIDLVRHLAEEHPAFEGMDVETSINEFIGQINEEGKAFLSNYLQELKDADLTDEQALDVAEIAIKTIEADNNIEYDEVKFFKKLRKSLMVPDDMILSRMPDKEDYLLPDIMTPEDYNWDVHFDEIKLK